MAVSDTQFRIAVLAGGALLVAVIIGVRFCGELSLPPKPAPSAEPTGTESQLLAKSTTSPSVYRDFLEHDAALAGVRAPTIEEMSRKLAYHIDEPSHGIALAPGKPPIELAGLRLHIERKDDTVVLAIQNLLDADVAYEVVTRPSVDPSACTQVVARPIDAIVLAKGATALRTECGWFDDITIVVTKVETMEVPPLSSWYLSQLPPRVLGVEERVARGHRANDQCSPVMPAVVRTGIERGEITWRDLVDFYARHRCQTYQFPPTYRAFKSDGERELPAVDR
ncbi:MAG TPA: hypothetical protein VLX92_08550 [Kofleriaceae bacterium]|nr:hypothetical protein [Kofleriaceae bacterium]